MRDSRAARGTWSGSLLGIGSRERRTGAAAVRRLLPGTDPRGGRGQGAPAAAARRRSRRPRLLALFQASPSSPPRYKRRDRGARASLGAAAGRLRRPVASAPGWGVGSRRVPVRLPATVRTGDAAAAHRLRGARPGRSSAAV